MQDSSVKKSYIFILNKRGGIDWIMNDDKGVGDPKSHFCSHVISDVNGPIAM